MAPLLHLRDVALTFGGQPLLEGAEIAVSAGERVCLVGRNGSGKSTLLKIVAGIVEPDSAERFVQPGATIRYLPQEPDFSGYKTSLAYVEAGLGPGDDAYRAQYLIEELGLTGEEDPASMSGGESRRAALARVLAPEPDILLLDEPTNHLDLPVIEWLEQELKSLRSAMVLISHDRRFLSSLSRATIWLDRGVTRRVERGFGEFEAWRDEVLAQEELDRHKLDRKIAREEDWLRYGVSARRTRNQRRLGELHGLREQRRTARHAVGSVRLEASEAQASGKLVIEAVDIAKAYDGRPVVKDFSLRVARGDCIGIVGPNGAGKTTLINLLTGALKPDSGKVKLGATLEMVTLDQRRESLDPATPLGDALTGGGSDQVMVGGTPRHVISYMKDFLFQPIQRGTAVGALSGGERGRLMLARALAKPSNLLVLDEPTNDLDIETLDLLQELLADYGGTVLLVSHDRDFLDRVVSSTLISDGDGVWTEFAGGYSDMLAQRGRGVGAKARAVPMKGSATASATPAPTASTAAAKRKLSFNEQHALKTLPQQLEKLQAEAGKLNTALAGDLYTRDPKLFAKATARLDEVTREIAQTEERWLELEMLREEIEA
ncbi:Holdfast attachment protein C [Bosea sp. 62]|uniref:ABC-F family ATP-binding cassette domain-containing protein n=1 Tax=unclassified Bosea (in: a-proteobacteria) TaxID=2653178 RepID=UPI001259DE9A|nr:MULTISPECIES: ATP-binding cassette domain-containing protein [unclassified Bosea (in: a-proteobacteria)]CAD5247718.1 Holdfast attachment protein C [Bosea sp. 46]CAD5249262.1 Holdfast attachment protein C [Bosea sp. 21B]CAD5266904.1 Holdfast attachment protein C [Bosea sp. 7B]VVT45094.1 Holdfast attachment protein C [Bosea sp. EC-HK365B]VXA99530.1 Holdfast attachment protein C [Bosea sp. 29B]